MNRHMLSITGVTLAIALVAPAGYAQKSDKSAGTDVESRGIGIVPKPEPPVRPIPEPSFSVSVWTDRKEYRIGESIRISYRSSRTGYVYVYSTDANGETRQLVPNYYDRDNKVTANRTYSIPDRNYRLQVTPPAGRETITIVAIPGYRPVMRQFESYSESDPFPRSSGAQDAIRAIVPDGRPNQGFATDSTSILVRRGWSEENNFGSLRVSTNPSGAYVYMSGNYVGSTPLELDRVRPGRYDVVIQRNGYTTVQRRVTISSDSASRISLSLQRTNYYESYGNEYDDSGWGYFQQQ